MMGRGDDAGVGADRHAATDGGEFAFLQHAQQPRLRLERHVADFIEKQGPAMRLLEPAHAAGAQWRR